MRTRKARSFLAATALGTAAFVQIAQAQEAAPATAPAASSGVIPLPEVDVVSPTPVPGAEGLSKDRVPAFVSTVTSQQFQDQKSPSVADAITANVPAAISLSVDGFNLSPDIYYRGFDISRISGTPQGLAVYQNGVRINEAFGDRRQSRPHLAHRDRPHRRLHEQPLLWFKRARRRYQLYDEKRIYLSGR